MILLVSCSCLTNLMVEEECFVLVERLKTSHDNSNGRGCVVHVSAGDSSICNCDSGLVYFSLIPSV